MKDRVDTPGSSVIGFGLPDEYIVICVLLPAWPVAHRYLPATGGSETSSHQKHFHRRVCPCALPGADSSGRASKIHNWRNVLPERHLRRDCLYRACSPNSRCGPLCTSTRNLLCWCGTSVSCSSFVVVPISYKYSTNIRCDSLESVLNTAPQGEFLHGESG